MKERSEDLDLTGAAVEGLRWLAIVRPLIEVALLGSMVVLARLIPPADFGHFAVAALFGEVAILLPAEGIGSSLVQRAEATREHLQAGFALGLLISCALIALAIPTAEFVLAPVFGDRTAELVLLSTPGFLLAGLGAVPIAMLRRRLDFRKLNIIELASSVVRALACVGLAVAGLDAEALILGGIAAGVLAVGLAFASARPPPPRLRLRPARDLLGYGLPASAAALSWVGFRNCDYAIIGARLGALQAGFYFRAYTLAVEYQKKVSLVMSQVGFPLLARTAKGADRAHLHHQMVRLLTMVLFPALTLLAALAPELVPWLFGQAWAPAVLPTQILAVGGAATLVIDAVGAALQAEGRAHALLGYGVAHFAVYAGAVMVLAGFGLTAVAIGAAVVHAGFLVVAYQLLLREQLQTALRTMWRDLAPAAVSSAALAAAVWPLGAAVDAAGVPTLLHLAAVTLAGGLVYVALLRIAFPQSWSLIGTIATRVLRFRRPAALRGARLAESATTP